MDLSVVDDEIAAAPAVAAAIRPRLTRHPVPQSDARTRGLLLELPPCGAGRAGVLAGNPVLAPLLVRLAPENNSTYLVAINETPPGLPDCFLMRPHLDRRWTGSGFSETLPNLVCVAFLDFPVGGMGGELAVFPPGSFAQAVPARSDARRTVTEHAGVLVAPRPGRVCRMAGNLPHAVLSFQAAEAAPWRMVLVVAAFAPG